MRHLFALAALLLPFSLHAITPTERGEDIAKAADSRLHGYVDMQVRLEMVLVSRSGETASRILRVQSRESANGGEKTLMAFETPRDLAGTALLT